MSAYDRLSTVIIGLIFCAFGWWMLYILEQFADEDGWFDLCVRIVVGELALLAVAIGIVLATSAMLPGSRGQAIIGVLAAKVYWIATLIFVVLALTMVAAALVGFCEWLGVI
jgi:hypothetical protein